MNMNWFENYTTKPSATEFYRIAPEVLKYLGDYRDFDKVAERKMLLDSHPELRIGIDTPNLRDIIPYQYFKCSPYSSVARNEAINGSDIDGGVVITSTKMPKEAELKFVAELRSQGFEVYHIREAEEADMYMRDIADNFKSQILTSNRVPNFRSLAATAAKMEDQSITFFSYQEIRRKIKEGRLTMPLVIALAGYIIQ